MRPVPILPRERRLCWCPKLRGWRVRGTGGLPGRRRLQSGRVCVDDACQDHCETTPCAGALLCQRETGQCVEASPAPEMMAASMGVSAKVTSAATHA